MPCLNIKESRLFGTRNIKSFRNTYFTFSEPHSGFEYSLHNSNSADHKIFPHYTVLHNQKECAEFDTLSKTQTNKMIQKSHSPK